MSNEPEITIGHSEYAERTAQLAAQCFADDPAFVYWLNTRPREWRHQYQQRLFSTVVQCPALRENYFLEANNWQCFIILTQPGADPETLPVAFRAGWLKVFWEIGLSSFKRIQFDYVSMFKAARSRHIGTGPHYHIFLCATHVDHRRKGLVTALLRECTKIAQSTGHPIWAEATTEKSCGAHAKAGFEMVEKITVGAGRCNRAGEAETGGEGVQMFGLVWKPKPREQLN